MSSFPSYLSSGAASRAQYALVSALERLDVLSSREDQKEARRVCDETIREVKKRWRSDGKRSEAQTMKDLLLLLQIHTLRPTVRLRRSNDTPTVTPKSPLAFSFIPCLTLLEHSPSLANRRIAMTYLSEVLPRTDMESNVHEETEEIVLLMINTIRKDLASLDEGWILLGLEAVIRFGSVLVGRESERRSLFENLLATERLKKHSSPSIRLRTSHALAELHIPEHSADRPSNAFSSGPSSPTKQTRRTEDTIRDIVDMLQTEKDPSVISALLRRLRKASPAVKSLTIPSEICHVLDTLSGTLREKIGKVHLDLLRTMSCVGDDADGGSARVPPTRNHLSSWSREATQRLSQIVKLGRPTGWNAAYINEVVSILADSSVQAGGELAELLLSIVHLVLGVSPKQQPSGVSRSQFLNQSKSAPVDPNTHLLGLRCLHVLPSQAWEDQLDTTEMELIMGGLDSHDSILRKLTLKLLAMLDPSLPDIHFDRLLQAMRNRNAGPESAERALEVLALQTGQRNAFATEKDEALSGHVERWLEAGRSSNDDVIHDVVTRMLEQTSGTGDYLRRAILDGLESYKNSDQRFTELAARWRGSLNGRSEMDISHLQIR